VNRVWLTPFSAPLESTRSPEVNSQQMRGTKVFGRQVTLKLKPDAVLANIIEEVPTVKTFDFVTSAIDPTFAGKLA